MNTLPSVLDRPTTTGAPIDRSSVMVTGHEGKEISLGDRARLCDSLFQDGWLPDGNQIKDVRDFLEDMGPLAPDVLGNAAYTRLSGLVDPDTWFEDPVRASFMDAMLSDAAEILLRREESDEAKAHPHSRLRLANQFDEDQTLAGAVELMQSRFGTTRVTPANLHNAIGLLHDALEVRFEELGHHGYRGPADAAGKAIGVARVTERPRAEQAPGGPDNLLWLMARDAKPRQVREMLFANKTVVGQRGAWARQPRRPISDAEKAEIRQLSTQLGVVNGYKQRIAKGGALPASTTLLDELIGRRESIEAYTEDEKALVQKVLTQLEEQRQQVADAEWQAASKADRLAWLRHRRAALRRWGERTRGDTTHYYEGYEEGEAPQRGRVARWIGTSAVWAATQFGEGQTAVGDQVVDAPTQVLPKTLPAPRDRLVLV